MSRKTLQMTDALQDYVVRHGVREHPVLARCREDTARMAEANMQIAAEQGALLQVLLRWGRAERALEIGTFTGYSALAMALALPDGGKLTCLDISEDYMETARGYWTEAGVADRIETRVGPAADSLAALAGEGRGETYDFAFVDADKEGYDTYYEACLSLLRPGGLIVFDNVLWSGRVADPGAEDADTAALRALNEKIAADARVDIALAPVADGLFLCVKRRSAAVPPDKPGEKSDIGP